MGRGKGEMEREWGKERQIGRVRKSEREIEEGGGKARRGRETE